MRSWFAIGVFLATSVRAAVPTPEIAEIPAGQFEMGSDDGHSWERPAHPVTVPAYRLGVRPVTNSEYRAFRPSHVSPGGNEPDQPVTGVSWYDAAEYCAWLSAQTGRPFRLPSEARWERAVRGDLSQKDYPWGDQAPASSGDDFSAGTALNAFGISAVGYNIWEWTADWYAADYYSRSPDFDPKGPEQGEFKVLRGGGYRGDPSSATTFTRGSARPDTRSEHITFRVIEAPGDEPAEVSRARPEPPPPAPAPEKPEPPKVLERPAPKPAVAQTQPAAEAAATPSAGLEIRDIEIIFPSTGPEIRISTNGRVETKAFGLSNPARLVCDLVGARVAMSSVVGEVPGGRGGVNRVRYSLFQPEPPTARIVVDLDRLREYEIESSADGVVIKLQP